MVSGVLFDFGHTLVNANSVETIFRLILGSLGYEVERERLLTAVTNLREYWRKNYSNLPRGGRWTDKIKTDCNKALLRELGLGADIEAVAAVVDREWRVHQQLRLFEDALPTLRSLKVTGLRMGVVSQNPRTSSDLHNELRKLGIGYFFEFVLTSEDAGYDKPDPRIFLQASEKMNLSPKSLCHVGNDYHKDVIGARAAGIAPILIDREGQNKVEDCPVVKKLTEVKEIIDRI